MSTPTTYYAPTDLKISDVARGAADTLAYSATVTYHYPDAPSETVRATFVGSRHGGPVTMVTTTAGREVQVHVTDPERFGRLSARWIRRFYGLETPDGRKACPDYAGQWFEPCYGYSPCGGAPR